MVCCLEVVQNDLVQVGLEAFPASLLGCKRGHSEPQAGAVPRVGHTRVASFGRGDTTYFAAKAEVDDSTQ